jgi:acyl-CoA synthetase (AMP-forming)/AMP-acid ligase II/3-oxoacyl-(acyl-carrier-protein) synthase/acyl carrier protein
MSPTVEFRRQVPPNLVNLLQIRAEELTEQLALRLLLDGEQTERRISFQAWDQAARSLAVQLLEKAELGDRVLLLHPFGEEFLFAFFGCLYAGLIPVPAYPPRNAKHLPRIEAIMLDSTARLVVTPADTESRVIPWLEGRAFAERLFIQRPPDPGLAQKWKSPAITPDSICLLQYTSGSTGAPKGVMVSHQNMLANLRMIQRQFANTEDSSHLSWLPFFHDMGLIGNVMQPLYLGTSTTLLSPAHFLQKPIRWLQAITRYRPKVTGAPNFAYQLCLTTVSEEERQSLDLSSLEIAYNGAEPIVPGIVQGFCDYFAHCGFRRSALYPCYGLAEATLFVTSGIRHEPPLIVEADANQLRRNTLALAKPGVEAKSLVSCGYAPEGETIAIVHPDTCQRVPDGAIGEIWVQGTHVARGYWQKPGLSEQVFRARIPTDSEAGTFLRTGDLGAFFQGQLFVSGRIKELLIVRGRNYYPRDIEWTAERSHSALLADGGVAFSVPIDGEEKVVVLQEVKRSERHRISVEEITGAIRQAVAEEHGLHLQDVLLLNIGAIPKTSSGKIQRLACAAAYLKGEFKALKTESKARVPSPVAKPNPTIQGAAEVESWLQNQIAGKLKTEPSSLDRQAPFAQFGLDSLDAVRLSGELGSWLNRRLSPTLIYDYPSIAALAAHLTSSRAGGEERQTAVVAHEAIAVIGMACRFPGADNPGEFWEMLLQKRGAIRRVPAERYRLGIWKDREGVPPWGGFLEGLDLFDAEFFRISPREAAAMDPQQRLTLEVVWEALERAGLAPDSLAGSSTGVFLGMSAHDFSRLLFSSAADISAYAGTGGAASMAANRVSYFLDLRGPSLAVDTACSSSLVAVHLACESLRRGECELAIAGGVNALLGSEVSQAFSQAGMLTPDGRCKTFDARADGYVRSEGCGMVILKPLRKARAGGDAILAVIRGSAITQDGRSNGLTAPNGRAQEEVISRALTAAQVNPSEVSFVETHGTGTHLGDPIEANAILRVLGRGRSPDRPCFLGSVKTNIGHLEAAAGIAALIKTILALQHRIIPPNLNFETLNPHIPLEGSGFVIPTEPIAWLAPVRYAGVSSLGFGGTNVHAILEAGETEPTAKPDGSTGPWLFPLSARSLKALVHLAAQYRETLQRKSAGDLPAICATAARGRTHFEARAALVVNSLEDLKAGLTQIADGAASKCSCVRKQPSVALVLVASGQAFQDRFDWLSKLLPANALRLRGSEFSPPEIVAQLAAANPEIQIFIGDPQEAAELQRTQVKAKPGNQNGGSPWHVLSHSEIGAAYQLLANLYVSGVPIEFTKLVPERRVDPDLPTYPFERSSHWPEVKPPLNGGVSLAPKSLILDAIAAGDSEALYRQIAPKIGKTAEAEQTVRHVLKELIDAHVSETGLAERVAPAAGGSSQAGGVPEKAPLRLRLEQTPEALRRSVLREQLQQMLGVVLQSPPGNLPDANIGFFDLGLDSIMAVEFKNKIENSLGVKLPISASFNYPSITELVEHLLHHPTVLSPAPVPPAKRQETEAADPETSVEAQIEVEIAALNRLR